MYFNQTLKSLPPNLRILNGRQLQPKLLSLPFFSNSSAVFIANCSFLSLFFFCSMYFNQTLKSLPPNLRILKMGDNFIHTLNSLPSSVTELHLGTHFNQPINSLPSSLRILALGGGFSQPLDSLPSQLQVRTKERKKKKKEYERRK